MKKRIGLVVILSIFLVILLMNSYLEIEYDLNLLQHFTKSQALTPQERKWLNERGKIIYGSDENSPPLRYVDEINGQYSGLVVDYIRALSIELGTEIEVKPLDWWDNALRSLSKGDTDFFDMIPSEKRGKLYDFSDPIYILRGSILVSKDQGEIHSYKDLMEKKVAVVKGDYAFEFLDGKVEDIDYTLTLNMQEAINHLINGKVDAIAGDEPVIIYYLEKMKRKDDFIILDPPMYEYDSVFAVPKSEKILLSILNKGIYQLKKKKMMAKIQQKWFGIPVPSTQEDISQKMGLIILTFSIITFFITYLFYSWNSSLKKEVKRRTEELYISRNNLQTTFDGLTHLMLVIDKGHNILNANRSFCRLLGVDLKEIERKNCKEFKDILYGHGVECVIDNTFSTGKQQRGEFIYKDKVFEMNTFPIENEINRNMNILIMIKDITKIRISERQLLHESKMAAIGQLAAGVAHEIRNPLGLIRNYCYILKHNTDYNKNNEAIEIMEESVEKASNIIDNLLNFSRMTGRKWDHVNMKKFIMGIINLEKKIFEKNNIDYEILCDEKLACYVNEESLKHIFLNLISNAIDAMPDGGLIKIVCTIKEDMLSIICSDTGIGISQEHLRTVFDPFFTTKVPGKGTGLGLYVTYNEIRKNGGKIYVTSELEKGTSFHILLPLREELKYGSK